MTMLAVRLLLGGMFVVAALAKLTDRDGVRRAVTAFGVPAAASVGRALIAAEFGIAAMLLALPSTGAVAALIALAGFSAVVLASLARGRRLECHCFGRLSAGPLGWPTVARNGFFATLAAYVALDGQSGWALTAFAAAMLGLWLGPAAHRRWASRPGVKAAALALPDRTGRIRTLDELGNRKPLVLVFSQPGCGACDALLPEVARWQSELDGRVTVALINGGPAGHRVPLELIDESRASFAAYGITATPSAVLIEGGQRTDTARGAGAIGELVERAAGTGQSTFTRRGLLRSASVGLLPVVGATAAACDSGGKGAQPSNVNAFEVDGAWLCNQTFALCTTAPCVPSPTDPNISICNCVVVNGYSVGFKNCTERAQTGSKVRSAFSTVNVNANFGVLSCPSGVPWANCLDVECEIDATNPAVAKCQCLTVKTGESLTFGGGCDTATCTSTIWSAATPDLPATTQYRKGMNQIGQPVNFPKTCPAPHP
ncbi:MauE/DoxX family redox-associated membrane protein [Mycobacterium sp. 1081908.1]|uniref:MauE/DoxX family redox-associated membrane protein n=1 Tax=Mycobacterium sp. 1081908.1 TaxID=1834066 RepID=UPI0009EDB265|nr:MauE/DoxX family redox-associated membrane protein [Mycobacterium sp. 1081908.1]